mgnify:CR=1 FL=1
MVARLIRLVVLVVLSVPFVEAYCLDRLSLHDTQGAADGDVVDRSWIVATTVPPQLYSTNPPVPPSWNMKLKATGMFSKLTSILWKEILTL